MAPIELPGDLASLREVALRQHEQLAAQAEELRILREHIRLLKHHRFGRKSEQSSDAQVRLFNEAETTVDATEREPWPPTLAPRAGASRCRPGSRASRSSTICPRTRSSALRTGQRSSGSARRSASSSSSSPRSCACCATRPKYACPTCRTGIHTAPLPAQPIPKSLASPTLLAHVAVSKYADGLRLYRQEEMFRRMGIDLPRASLANWMVKMGELVVPLVNLLRDELLDSGFVQCDETRYQVLKEPDKPATSQSYLWVQHAPEADIVLYDYDPSRSAEVPKRLFAGFQGFLQTDGYEGYGAIGSEPGIIHVGC